MERRPVCVGAWMRSRVHRDGRNGTGGCRWVPFIRMGKSLVRRYVRTLPGWGCTACSGRRSLSAALKGDSGVERLLRGVRVQGQQGLARRDGVAGLAWSSMPAPNWTASSLRARPCAEAPGRHRRRRRRPGWSGHGRGGGGHARLAGDRQRGVRVAALGRRSCGASGPWPSRRTAPASAGSASFRPAASSISRASASGEFDHFGGPPPARTSTDSRTSSALPARPGHAGEQGDRLHTVVEADDAQASSRASSRLSMKAPEPTFTSDEGAGALGDLLGHDGGGGSPGWPRPCP